MNGIWATSKGAYMLFGMVFALLAIVLIAIFGDQAGRACAIGAAIFLAYSQFAAQDGNRAARIVNIASGYIALFLLLLAVWRMYSGIP